MALYGADLSHYQSTDTVDQAKDYVILKATEGFDDASGPGYVDPDCDNKYQRAKSQGKLLGVYGYAIMLDAVKEATFFVNNIQGYLGEALLALDNETHTDVAFAKLWLDTVYSLTQVRPMIYMSASTAKAADWSSVSADYALWVAGYDAEFNVPNPGMPAADGSDMPYATGSWPFATIWQYSSSAGTLDRDIAYMDATAWHKFAMGDRQAAPPPTPPALTPPVVTATPAPVVIPVQTPVVVNDPLPATPVVTTPSVLQPPSSTPSLPTSKLPTTKPTVVATPPETFLEKLAHYQKGVVAFLTVALSWVATNSYLVPQNYQHWYQLAIGILGAIGVVTVANKSKS
jgi:hypothetical protein